MRGLCLLIILLIHCRVSTKEMNAGPNASYSWLPMNWADTRVTPYIFQSIKGFPYKETYPTCVTIGQFYPPVGIQIS